MKLEPVYLVQPDPAPAPRAVSRRSLVIGALSAALCGAAFGSLARRVLRPAAAEAIPADLLWALELQERDIETLVQRHLDFLSVLGAHGEHAHRLVPGLQRLAAHARSAQIDPAIGRQLEQAIVTAIEASGTRDQALLDLTRQLGRR